MIRAYAMGLCTMSVCTDLPREEVETAANVKHPTGSPYLRWKISPDSHFRTGEPNPCSCDRSGDKGHMHYLMEC